jgi:hypothetical protein
MPSVEEISKIMLDADISRNYIAARVAHAIMQELAVRPKMMIDGMTKEQIKREFLTYLGSELQSWGIEIASDCADRVYELANTPAAPDPDAGAKELAFKWHQSTKHGVRFSHADLYWIYIGNRKGTQDAWRAVAAKDKP